MEKDSEEIGSSQDSNPDLEDTEPIEEDDSGSLPEMNWRQAVDGILWVVGIVPPYLYGLV